MLGKILNIFKPKPKVVVILGPTSTGKTSLSIKIAKEFNGEIISADSRQIYKNLNLISGKITETEKENIPHHMIDVISIGDSYSVELYKNAAKKKIKEILSRGKLPIICGGTGFYIDSLVFKNSFPEVEPDQEIRDELDKKSANELFDMLVKIDKKRSESIDRHNKVRLIRAIEIAKKIGQSPNAPSYKDMNYKTLFIGLDIDDSDLKTRIKERIEMRWNQGMVSEAKWIIDSGRPKEVLYLLGLDAKFSAMVACGEITEEKAKEELFLETWQYAKRQRTYWKRNKNIKWFEPKNIFEISNAVREFLNR